MDTAQSEDKIVEARPAVAYFSMEIGLRPEMKEYAGGLGILAGDTLKAAADLGINIVGVSLLYKKGYFKQNFDANGIQQEESDSWDYEKYLTNTGKVVQIELVDGPAYAEIWQYIQRGLEGGEVKIYFLNTDIESNQSENRFISYNLYTNYQHTRLRQELMLGIGGVYALEELGYEVHKYHLNESHAAFGILALAEIYGSMDAVKEKVVFTTHTPAEHGHVKYPKERLQSFLAPRYIAALQTEWEDDILHLTKFCLRYSSYANGVAKRHGEVSRKMFPNYTIEHITNGVHLSTWAGIASAQVYDEHLAGWRQDPARLRGALQLPDAQIAAMHRANKREMAYFIKSRYDLELDPNVFTIGFGRRVDGYKRSGLIFRDITRLQQIAEKHGGLQMVISGKAYFDYGPAEQVISEILAQTQKNLGALKIFFLTNYDMNVSKMMVQGCDIWLNNPIKPLEASGTSGMKAALNGVPNFSTIDGWWVEGWQEGITGWAIGGEDIAQSDDATEAANMYDKLDNTIMPLYLAADISGWAQVQKQAIAYNGDYFNTHRMLQEYVKRAYGW
jgi:starch phosphorylase